ncbi:hypothetical protein [Pseudofrankia asymbiotica]|uniref:Uncharacterized protein n=1 Tax=Pseudofrankia asymbiotica TaxID=1834516 RepID=A0A1V2I2A7_9ACTN|nr:hypothetical protein [Pseudofrankia asymbiotica]ONH24285.1 hypothetical protein BL253_30755 [Pseudofrankia asymbiotica]
MGADGSEGRDARRRGVRRVVPPVTPRTLAKVPFVELAEGRLRGVVSSGSDIERVYVSSIVAGTHEYSCGTNNNRPCGGLTGGGLCNHLRALVDAAVLQYGGGRVARYLRVDGAREVTSADDVVARLRGGRARLEAAAVFSGFLRHLGYLELPDVALPVPELDWFPAGQAAL